MKNLNPNSLYKRKQVFHAFCQKQILKIKIWASLPKCDFLRQKILQTMFFSSYQTQNLGFIFSKGAICLPSGIVGCTTPRGASPHMIKAH